MGDHFAVMSARSTREHASHTPDEEAVRHSSTAPDTMLRLQSLVGNQAAQRLVQNMGAHGTLQRDKTRPAKRDASLGLGFSNLRHVTKGSPDVLGNTQADNGSLGDFRKAVADAPLGPKLSPEQSLALGKL